MPTPRIDRRRRTDAEKAQTRAKRQAKASERRRQAQWIAAAHGAADAGTPFNVVVHLTWFNLANGDRRGGRSDILGLDLAERERRVWSALRQIAARHGGDWIAARAPEYIGHRGQHLHLALHLPDMALTDVIEVVQRLTGVPAEWVDLRGRSVRNAGRPSRAVIGRSACGGWLVQRSTPNGKDGGTGLLEYMAKGDGKAQVDGQHRLSNAAAALAREHAKRRNTPENGESPVEAAETSVERQVASRLPYLAKSEDGRQNATVAGAGGISSADWRLTGRRNFPAPEKRSNTRAGNFRTP